MTERESIQHEARLYERDLLRAHNLVARSMMREERFLTWLTGLMGAGLVALQIFIDRRCRAQPPYVALIALPWAVGLMLTVCGRVVKGRHRDADALLVNAKLSALRSLLGPHIDTTEFQARYQAIRDNWPPAIHERYQRLVLYARLASWVFYSSIAAFLIGVLLVYGKIARC